MDYYPNWCTNCTFPFDGNLCEAFSIWAILLALALIIIFIVTAIVTTYCVMMRCRPKYCGNKRYDGLGQYSVVPLEGSEVVDENVF